MNQFAFEGRIFDRIASLFDLYHEDEQHNGISASDC